MVRLAVISHQGRLHVAPLEVACVCACQRHTDMVTFLKQIGNWQQVEDDFSDFSWHKRRSILAFEAMIRNGK